MIKDQSWAQGPKHTLTKLVLNLKARIKQNVWDIGDRTFSFIFKLGVEKNPQHSVSITFNILRKEWN